MFVTRFGGARTRGHDKFSSMPPGMEFVMGFPVISPIIVKELSEKPGAPAPDEFCDVVVSSYAIEYAPMLNNESVVRKLMEKKDILEYNMVNLDDENSAPFIEQSKAIAEAHPITQYYWQMRMLIMTTLQNREVNLEKRFLLLNYAMKIIQNLIDGGQQSLIPQFVGQFTAPENDLDKVLEYFKDIRPSPGYSLADGISLLKSLTVPGPAYKEVLGKVYKSLGVSGPETLKLMDLKKYLEMRKRYSDLAAGEKSHYIENAAISYVWTFSLPFATPDYNFWEHFVFFCTLYNALKVLITCTCPDGDDEKFVKAITAFDSAVRATGDKLISMVINSTRNSGQNNNGDMAILAVS